MDALLEWMKQGTVAHAKVIADVLHCGQNTLIYEHAQFVREALDLAEVVDDKAVDAIRSAIKVVTLSGARTTTPGVPYQEDVKLFVYARKMLERLSRADPAYELFSGLLGAAKSGIERQIKEKEALDAQDEE